MVTHRSTCSSSCSWNIFKKPTVHRGLAKPQILLYISCKSCGITTFISVEMCNHRHTDETRVFSAMKENNIEDPEGLISWQTGINPRITVKPSFSEIKLIEDIETRRGLKFLALLMAIAAIMIGAVTATYTYREHKLKCTQGQILSISSFHGEPSINDISYRHNNRVNITLSNDINLSNLYIYDHEIESTPLETASVPARMKKLESFRWMLCKNEHLHLAP